MNLFMKLKLAICLYLVCAVSSLCSSDLLSQSEAWPYRIELRQDVETMHLKEGQIGVLVRAYEKSEGQVKLLVDFGRNGMHSVSPDWTDIQERIFQIQTGGMAKDMPNYVQLLANKFVLLRPEDNYKLKLEEFEDYEGFAFLYPTSARGMHALLDLAKHDDSLHQSIILVLPDFDMDPEQMRREIREYHLEAGYLFPHLLNPYRKTLSHDVDGADVLIVTDKDGRILRCERLTTL